MKYVAIQYDVDFELGAEGRRVLRQYCVYIAEKSPELAKEIIEMVGLESRKVFEREDDV